MKEQLLWEQECVERGQQRYFDTQDKTREKGNNLTDATSFILKDRLELISNAIKEDCSKGGRGLGASYNKLVKQVAGDDEDYLKVAYMGLKLLLAKVSEGKKVKVSKFVARLGSALEAELKCAMFQAEEPAYFHTVKKSFDDQGVTSSVHMQKALMKKFKDFGLSWADWTTQMKVHTGVRVLRNMLKCMDDLIFTQKLMSRGKTDYFIDTTVAFDEWVAEFEKERGLLLPMRLPLKCPPVPWADNDLGGYYTPRMYIPFIKTSGKDAREFVAKHNPMQHKRAVNKMQRTAWKINDDVLKVQEKVFQLDLKIGVPSRESCAITPFPEHLLDVDKYEYTYEQKEEVTAWKILRKRQYDQERQRKGQVLGFRQGHLLAQELRDWEELYFVYNCDFRGRIYCATTGLSPQGSDASKGLLQFAKGVRLGRDGIKWLAIQGANTFGEDKVSYDDRVKWVQDNEDLIRAIVADPISNNFWGDADKPYQFLAFCFEWARADYGRNPNAIGYLPVGLDGSCNGLQHFSAMLRDDVGAKATNLLPCDKPEDIYGEVAKVTMNKLKALAHGGDAYAKIWLQVGVDRKCTKRPVMTLPYGATQQSARTYIVEYVYDNWPKFNMDEKYQWEMTKYLTPILWESIGEVVIAARAAMDWLQKHVGNEFCSWVTVLGFPVYQHYRADNNVQIRTFIEGSVRLYVPDLDKGIPYKAGQRSGVAPNFVHSIDSTHMVITINAVDLHSYAMIHDDFGTHAGNTQQLFTAIRKAFRYMYKNTDPLRHWAKQLNVTTIGLPRGHYNIEEITNADYFFG
jgi:DNA-directed RNA polymerase